MTQTMAYKSRPHGLLLQITASLYTNYGFIMYTRTQSIYYYCYYLQYITDPWKLPITNYVYFITTPCAAIF